MRILAVLFCSLLLSACGLQPLYSNGSNGAVASGLGRVEVSAIEGRGGWLVRNALNDRIGMINGGKGAEGAPVYRLDVKLDERLEGFGVLRDDSVTRERRTLRARYQLIDIASGDVVLDATAGSDAGIDVVSSEYATIAAENTALENLAVAVADQIVTRLALRARESATAP